MKKLHVDGILEYFDFESIDACENFPEMIETPFVGKEDGRLTYWILYMLMYIVHYV